MEINRDFQSDDCEDLIGTKAIQEIMGYAFQVAASSLCKKGVLKTARKVGKVWMASRAEIEQYKKDAQDYIHDRVNCEKGQRGLKRSREQRQYNRMKKRYEQEQENQQL